MTARAGARLPVTLGLGAVLRVCSLSFIGGAVLAPRILVDMGLAPQLLVPAARR